MQFPFELKQNTDFDVVAFGTNAVDFLIQVPHYPEFNSKVELTRYDQMAGGEAASTAAGLQRLGLRAAYAGRFGTDAAGGYGLQTLRDEGVDTTYAEQVEGAKTQIAFIVIDERSGERTVIWQRDAKLAYTAGDAPLAAVGRSRVLHLTPHDVEACIAMARRARETGVIVSIDIDRVFDGVEDLLPLVDILIASSELPEKLTGASDHRENLSELARRFGSAVTGITLGESGSLLLAGGEFIETHGFAVSGGCKDTTGAGDSFRVGLLYGLVTGASIEDSARMANAVAALKCRAVGARTALPTAGELSELLSESGR
jgi:sugar/nucleoside kinase (ribokinase family)